MRAYLKPLLIFGLVVLIVVIASWFAFPGWRAQPGGAIALIGAAIAGVLAVVKELIGIAKDWRELTKPRTKKATATPRARKPSQTQLAENSPDSEQSMKHSGGTQRQTVKDSPRSKQHME